MLPHIYLGLYSFQSAISLSFEFHNNPLGEESRNYPKFINGEKNYKVMRHGKNLVDSGPR